MATPSGLNLYNDQFSSGAYEGIAQQVDLFENRSGNALRIVRRSQRGRKTETDFFTNVQMVGRRDPTSNGVVTPTVFTDATHIKIKLYRQVRHDWYWQDFVDKGLDTAEGQRLAGVQFGIQKAQDYLNTALSAVVGALLAVGANITHDITGEDTKTLNHPSINRGYAKLGDQSARIVTLIMHSVPYFDLIGDTIVNREFAGGAMAIGEGRTVTGGRVPIMTDAAPLVVTADTPDSYYSLGLVENAVVVEESEDEIRDLGIVRGDNAEAPANIKVRLSIDYAITLNMRGVSYTGATLNPDAATLATAANWTQKVSSHKLGPGVIIKSQ